MQITVYSTPRCVQCKATYRWLDQRGITYRIEDATDEDNNKACRALGHTQAPIVVVSTPHGDEHWSSFRPDLLEEHCNKKGLP